MKGYVVMDAEITDTEAYADFAKQVSPGRRRAWRTNPRAHQQR